MADISRRGLLIAICLFLFIAVGIGLVLGFFVIPVEEACNHVDEENAQTVVNSVKDKLVEESYTNKTSTRSDKYQEALDLIELVTCPSAKNWTWAPPEPSLDLPGNAGKIPDWSEVQTKKWFGLLADRLADIKCLLSHDLYEGLCEKLFGSVRQPDIANWRDDNTFVKSFLTGVNPLVVRMVESLDEIREEFRNMSFDGGETASSLLGNKKLYVADYSSLANIPLVSGSVLYAPQVLLAKTIGGHLNFLAILLSSPHAPHTPILVTKDTPDLHRLFAWMHVSLADAQVHEFAHHLRDHFVMEAISIARHNWLEDDHFIGKLLKPHMTGTIFINFAARHSLVAPKNSLVQRMFSVGREGAMQLISEEMSSRYSWPEVAFPRMMEKRGFPQDPGPDGLKDYHYRDDGFALWDALHQYVEGVVQHTYLTDEEVREDKNLTGFHASLADPKRGNIPGFPEKPVSREQLTDTLTSIIFTGSVQHQAINAPQFTYSYQPHRPVRLTRWMPDEAKEITWSWIKEALPSPELSKEIYQLTNTLSTPMQKQCNLMSLPRVFQDKIPQVYDELQLNLQHLKKKVEERGGEYNFLNPEKVACSIDI